MSTTANTMSSNSTPYMSRFGPSISHNTQQLLVNHRNQLDKNLSNIPKLRVMYWDTFKKFLKAKISKQEFDNVINHLVKQKAQNDSTTSAKDFGKWFFKNILKILFY